ncbi:hypothetical protein QAD02_002579 [Eretmocerus hayati]|uniref:Uncharacterized protein n=1 Tax=Eretmocerus hayati TaxID=131215 RepID=A0ACC2NJB3_9HYME|nr:hypothetical protein QAD02_002579 [Eretmocerus hayati]
MQGDILQLEKDMAIVQTQVNNNNNRSVISDNIYLEVQERMTTAKNIILFHVPENPNILMGVQQVQCILKEIPVDTSNIHTYRIGTPAANTARPMIVTLNSPQDAHLVLKNKMQIDKIFIVGLDKTKMQQAQYKRAKSEMDQRLSAGEKDLIIRFVNDIPTVVK